jgi:diguanylate cyclase (GGDEF)-like protein/PAS domain S-box-containing protein
VGDATQLVPTDRLTAAVVLGVLVATVAILAFLWRAVRDPALAYLIALNGLFAYYVAASGGLLPSAMPLPLLLASVALLFAAGLAFAAQFFDLARHAPYLRRFVLGLAIGWIILAPLTALRLGSYARLLEAATIITVVVFLGVGVYACVRHLPGGRIFLAAWALAGLAGTMRAVGYGSWWTASELAPTLAPLHIGAGLAAILMAFAGAQRVRAQREANEAALRQSRERFALAARGANDGLFDWDIANDTAWCAGRLHDLLGVPDGSLNGPASGLLGLIEDLAAVEREMRDSFAKRQRKFQREFPMRHADGRPRWMQATGMILYGETGGPLRLIGSLRDVTDRKQAEEALRENESRYALAVRGASEGIYDWDLRARRIYFSDRHAEIAGVTPTELGTAWDSFLRFAVPEDRPKLAAAVRRLLAEPSRVMGLEYRIRRADGEERWVFTNGAVQCDASGKPIRIAGPTSDITERKRAEEKLLHDALHDRLTDLANRALFTERLGQALARPGSGFAVAAINLDRFRQVNDDLGHAAGDELLREIGRRLVAAAGPGDTVARFGSDEFALLLHGIAGDAAAEALAQRLRDALHSVCDIAGQNLYPSASIGMTLGPVEYKRPEDMIADATLAMYRAKGSGRGPLVAVPSRHACPRARPSGAGNRPAPRNRTRRACAASPADHRAERPGARRLRVAVALAPSEARTDPARTFHPDGGRNRTDRADRPVGAGPGGAEHRPLASSGTGRATEFRQRQRLGAAVHEPRLCCRHARGARRDGRRAAVHQAGDHREPDHDQSRASAGGVARARGAGRRAVNRRFRHRLFKPELPAPLPVPHVED